MIESRLPPASQYLECDSPPTGGLASLQARPICPPKAPVCNLSSTLEYGVDYGLYNSFVSCTVMYGVVCPWWGGLAVFRHTVSTTCTTYYYDYKISSVG